MSNVGFEEYFLLLAELISIKSKDLSTKVGAIVTGPNNEIISTGYNGFPIGANDKRNSWYERPKKYLVSCHAEENAIVFAARRGTPTDGCSIYVTHFPCATCMRMIIQSGIKKVYIPENPEITQHEKDFSERWKEQRLAAIEMANDCEIQIIKVNR